MSVSIQVLFLLYYYLTAKNLPLLDENIWDQLQPDMLMFCYHIIFRLLIAPFAQDVSLLLQNFVRQIA
jgi:hypothetical protein